VEFTGLILKEEDMTSPKVVFAGEVAQISGVGAVVVGIVLSLHHWGAAAALISGISAFVIGKKLRGA
jgi:hypothetical protein